MKTIQLSNACRPLAEYARELHEGILVLKEAWRDQVPLRDFSSRHRLSSASTALSFSPAVSSLIRISGSRFNT